jgi:hypothetical protein
MLRDSNVVINIHLRTTIRLPSGWWNCKATWQESMLEAIVFQTGTLCIMTCMSPAGFCQRFIPENPCIPTCMPMAIFELGMSAFMLTDPISCYMYVF